ncbi:alpha/beta hydrolase [Arenibacter sp. ARW7G5Y1]|uniref:alpha/beta hydrolase n=1 Tax=Arenibacter sp. ARW7G5Y1 TaxID=2135619 RepID=UPI000D75BED5|nr:alpha/beta hydrolase [Arenibacter sp. ARW7G5Y1]PXX26338.1 acetyl esterase/lipase [Arenibacter sp. ARW7G5Y1]
MKIISLILIIVSAQINAQVKDYLNDEHIDSGTKEFLKVLNTPNGPGLETLTKEDARQVLIGAQASIDVDLSGIEASEKTINQDGYEVKLNIVRPSGIKATLPVFMFIHGGGWILGDYPTHKRLVRDLVVRSGAVAVFVNYTPSPEAQFPTAINEIYAATKWVSKHGEEINVDGRKIAVVGNSVGGNMAAVTAIRAKEEKGPLLKAQILLWPVTDASMSQESYKTFAKDRFLTTAIMEWMWNQYTTNTKERNSIYASPLNASLEQLYGLPPTVILVAENDILRDEAEAYGRKLDKAGVEVATVRYNGTIHDFGMLNALASIPSTQAMLDHAAAEIKKYLK